MKPGQDSLLYNRWFSHNAHRIAGYVQKETQNYAAVTEEDLPYLMFKLLESWQNNIIVALLVMYGDVIFKTIADDLVATYPDLMTQLNKNKERHHD